MIYAYAALSKSVYLYRIFEDRIELFDVYSNSVEVAKLINLHKSIKEDI